MGRAAVAERAKPARPALGAERFEDDELHAPLDISVAQSDLFSVPRPSPRLAARSASVRRLPSEAPTVSSVFSRMSPALKLIGLGVAIMVVDVAYAATAGEAFRIGPARGLWIAGPLVGWGVVKLVLSLAS